MGKYHGDVKAGVKLYTLEQFVSTLSHSAEQTVEEGLLLQCAINGNQR